MMNWRGCGRKSSWPYVRYYFCRLSAPCGNTKPVTPCNPSFVQVLGHLQEGLSNVESAGECAIDSDHDTEYRDAER
jgi:hypothetical protein